MAQRRAWKGSAERGRKKGTKDGPRKGKQTGAYRGCEHAYPKGQCCHPGCKHEHDGERFLGPRGVTWVKVEGEKGWRWHPVQSDCALGPNEEG